MAVANQKLFVDTCKAMGHPEWATDPRFSTIAQRVANKPELTRLMEEVLVTDTKETWTQKLRVVHTDQIYPETGAIRQGGSPKLFQTLVVVMSVALILTTVLGLVLAFRFSRSLWPVVLSLVLGILAPVLVLWAGQHR